MATSDALPTAPYTGAFTGQIWVMPPTGDPDEVIAQINETMRSNVIGKVGGTERLFLHATGLILQDRQVLVTLVHGGQANLFVCDSMVVHQ